MSPVELRTRPSPLDAHGDRARPRRRLWGDSTLRRLLMAQTAGQTADAMTTLALTQVVVFELERGASATALVRTLLATTVPILAAGPLAGVVADRWQRRHTLVAASALRALLTVVAFAVPITKSPLIGYVVAAALLTVARILYATRVASLPHLVRPDDLVAADSLGLVCGSIAGAIGAAIGIGLTAISPLWVLAIATVLHVAAAAGFRRLPELGGHHAELGRRIDPAGGRGRLLHLLGSEPTRFAIVATGGHRFLLGAAFAAFVLLAGTRYHLESSGYAIALGIMASGGFIGTLVAPFTARRFERHHIAAGAYTVAGTALVLAGHFPESAVVLAAMMISAFAFQNLRLVTDALVQAEVADDALGRIFAVYDIVNHLAFVGGALAAVALAHDGAASLFPAVGAGMTAIGVTRHLLTIGGTRNLVPTGRIR